MLKFGSTTNCEVCKDFPVTYADTQTPCTALLPKLANVPEHCVGTLPFVGESPSRNSCNEFNPLNRDLVAGKFAHDPKWIEFSRNIAKRAFQSISHEILEIQKKATCSPMATRSEVINIIDDNKIWDDIVPFRC